MRTRQILAAVLSVLALLTMLAGLPVLLLAVGGNPLPSSLPSLDQVGRVLTAPDDGRLILAAAIWAGWICWVLLLVATVAEAVDQVAAARGAARPAARSGPGLSVPRSLLRPLVASILAVLVTAPAAATAAPALADTAASAPVQTDQSVSAPADDATTVSVETDQVAPASHTVEPGDTLWGISADRLGAGERFGEIYAANADQITDPDLIYPGTVLALPGTPETIEDLEAVDVQVAAGDTLSGLAHEHLGEAARWPEIFTASVQVDQGGGARLTDPDLIEVGWRLRVPTESAAPSSTTDRTVQVQDADPVTTPTERAIPDQEPAADEGPARTLPSASMGASLGRHLATVDAPGPATAQDPRTEPGPVRAEPGKADPSQDVETVTMPVGAGWLVAGLAGAGGVLAGALWLGLRSRRRTQARFRIPGRAVGEPAPAELGPIEATAQVLGPVAAVSLETLDRVLKHLVLATDDRAPELVAARLSSTDGIDLFLAGPRDLPDPWEPVTKDGTRWRLARPVSTPAPEVEAPYPLLATVGTDDTEGTWLLNLEGLHVAITGDPVMAQDLARHVAAGALLNPWSQTVQVDCVQLGAELHPMDPTRVVVHGVGDDDLAQVQDHLAQTASRAHRHECDTTTARVQAIGDDTWPARLVMVGVSTEQTRRIGRTISSDPAQVSAAIMVTGTPEPGENPSLVLEVSERGRLQVGEVGLDLVAVGLTEDEAVGCALMCAAATDHSAQPVPDHDVDDTQDLKHYVDRAGALLPPFRTDPTAAGTEEQSGPGEMSEEEDQDGAATDDLASASVLPAPAQDYLDVAATTQEDLQQVAPHVRADVAETVQALDPTLDDDLAAWHDQKSRRPRLRLLGPVKAETFGVPQSHSKGYLTEILAYLALRPEGVAPEKLAEAFGLTAKKARDYVSTVRKWLGTDPSTGQLHLPFADDVVRHDGVKVYKVSGILVDADLLTRLHTRGVARGAEGIEDLVRALELVTGQPFTHLRRGGWGWLFESTERHDQYMVVAIGTVAHLITVHSLESGDLPRARWAAQVAQKADPYAETPTLDLAAVAMAEGRHEDSARLLRTQVTDRSDDHLPPPELPARTEQVLRAHPDWLDDGQDQEAAAS